MDFLQPGGLQVGIDLGRGNIGMAQQQLQGPEIGALPQQMGGKGVAQGMRT